MDWLVFSLFLDEWFIVEFLERDLAMKELSWNIDCMEYLRIDIVKSM